MKSLIVNPVMCDVYDGRARGFAKIQFSNDGRLSICGVIGPTSNGDCKGSSGQCVDEIRAGTPIKNWTSEMLAKFCDIWDRWHLNDLRPECKHQRELGWKEQACEKILLYHYRLTDAANKAKNEAEKAAVNALRKGESFIPTAEQQFFASLPYSLDIYETPKEEVAPYYQPKKPLYSGDVGAVERKTRGWVRYEESELGILCKPCPVCGYKYGSSWLKEEVPQDILDWLFALPETKVTPAWI